jgi:hypothetical protein
VFFIVEQDGIVLKRAFHQVAIPSEMINLTLPKATSFKDGLPITISIKERP